MAAVTPTPFPAASPSPATVSEAISEGLAAAGETTGRLVQSLPLIGSRLLFAAAAVLCGLLLTRLGRRLIDRLVQSRATRGTNPQHRETFRSLLDSGFRYVMYFVIITVVLSIFGVNVSSLIAVAGVGGVAIGFGAQTLIKDVISGIFLWAEGTVAVGDTVQVNGMSGTVEAVTLRTTTLRDFNGSTYVVPNGDIRTIANMNRTWRRAVVDVRVNYEDDLAWLLDILRDEMKASRAALAGLREAPQVLGVTAMAADCITVRIAAMCDPDAVAAIERSLRERVKVRLDREGVQIPHMPVMRKAGEDKD